MLIRAVLRPLLLLSLSLTSVVQPVQADDGRRVVKTGFMPDSKEAVIVAEGDKEPRSIGSYSVRLYARNDPAYPYDRFIAGIVRPRNGMLQDLSFADIDRNGQTDIVVTTRYAGSGNFVTVEAFHLHGKTLRLLASVAGLDAKKDAIQALQQKLAKR